MRGACLPACVCLVPGLPILWISLDKPCSGIGNHNLLLILIPKYKLHYIYFKN